MKCGIRNKNKYMNLSDRIPCAILKQKIWGHTIQKSSYWQIIITTIFIYEVQRDLPQMYESACVMLHVSNELTVFAIKQQHESQSKVSSLFLHMSRPVFPPPTTVASVIVNNYAPVATISSGGETSVSSYWEQPSSPRPLSGGFTSRLGDT